MASPPPRGAVPDVSGIREVQSPRAADKIAPIKFSLVGDTAATAVEQRSTTRRRNPASDQACAPLAVRALGTAFLCGRFLGKGAAADQLLLYLLEAKYDIDEIGGCDALSVQALLPTEAETFLVAADENRYDKAQKKRKVQRETLS